MFLFMFTIFAFAFFHLAISSTAAPAQGFSTLSGANSWFADVVLTKISYYRALSNANPLVWNDTNADLARTDTANCSLEYDTWSPSGQIIFRIGRQDDQEVGIVNSTYFAIDHWYDLRRFYRPTSDDWDEIQPFYNSSEFTQMVWKANLNVGCAWQEEECGMVSGDSSTAWSDLSRQPVVGRWKQLVCYMSPGGNKWDQFGLEVECVDCDTPEQSSTVDIGSLPTDQSQLSGSRFGKAVPVQGLKTPFNRSYWDQELRRIEQARYSTLEDFKSGNLHQM